MTNTEPSGADGSYVEGSAFTELLGSRGKTEMLEVFLGKYYEELSAAQVADLAGIDVSTFHRNVDVLLDYGIVEETRTVGGTQLYSLDTENPIAKALGEVQAAVLDQIVDSAATGDAIDGEPREQSDGSERSPSSVSHAETDGGPRDASDHSS